MANFKLSKQAQRDLTNLLRESAESFGPKQALRYGEQLRAMLEALAEKPTPGTPYKRSKRRMLWVPCGSHTVFYRLPSGRGGAFVVRILHGGQLPARSL